MNTLSALFTVTAVFAYLFFFGLIQSLARNG